MTISIRTLLDEEGRVVYRAADPQDEQRAVALREAALRAQRAEAEVEAEDKLSTFAKIVLAVLASILGAVVDAQLWALLPEAIKQNRLFKGLSRAYKNVAPTVLALRQRLEAEQQRIKGILDRTGIAVAVRAASRLHRIGLIVSLSYRRRVENMYRATSQVSRRVFGDTIQIQSALNLLRMAIADTTGIVGQEVDIADNLWFSQSIRVLDMVEKNSSNYARRPESFWADFNTLFMRPQYEAQRTEQRRRNGVVNALANTVRLINRTTVGVSSRFNDYRRELDPFLSPDNRRKIDSIIRDFDQRVRLPISQQ
jgi:hypothetical protein